MGALSLMHWIVVLVIVLLLFGAGKLPSVMGDVAKGIKSFKRGMREDEPSPPRVEGAPEPRPPGQA